MKFEIMPKSLLFSFIGILCIPAIAYGSLQFMLPSSPDLIYTSHGKLKIEWVKLSENDEFTEYVSKERNSDSDGLTVNVLVLRNYFEPQTEIMNNIPVTYSSAVLHETINCLNQKITDENIFVYSKNDAKGNLLRAIIGSDYEPIQATPGSVAERKVFELCSYGA